MSHSARGRRLLNKAFSVVSLVALTLSFNGVLFAPAASAASLVTDFRQASNNTGAGLGVVTWINSIIQSSNSVYYEGMGVPQRVLFTNVPAAPSDIHSLTFSHQFTKGGVHAYDFLVSWAAAQEAAHLANTAYDPDLFSQTCGENIGPPGTLQATCTALLGMHHLSIPVPSDTFTSWAGGSVNTKETAFDTRVGMSDATARSIDVYANAPISAGSVTFTHNVPSGGDTGDSDVDYVLNWTSTATQYLIQFAGHLAVSGNAGTNPEAWTPTTGSSQISGGPYHFHIYTLDGASLGAQDNQIKGADILFVPNTPSVSTTMSETSPIAIGTSVHDSATITGATSDAGGTISYGLYSDNTCSTLVQDLTPATATVVNGVAPDSTSYTFNSAGTWYFQATYSGDANNTGPVSSSCTSETMVVSPNTPTINTTPNPSTGAVGAVLNDSATLANGNNPQGTITFNLYGPGDATCAGPVLFTQDVTVSGNNVYATTVGYTTTAPGTFHWTASYVSSDANNTNVASGCADEPVVISGGNFGYTPGFWQNKNGHNLIDQYTLLPVLLGQQGTGLRSFNVETIVQSDKILPPPNGCATSIFNCKVTGLSQDLSQGTFENLAMQTLALAYNIEYFGDVGTVFGTQTLGQLGATSALGLTSSSTVQDVLDLANQLIANSASGGSTTQAQASAMINLISYIDSI